MTPQQIQQLGPAFARYLQQFLFCCDYTQTFHLLEVYCKGLLSDLPRKSAEPIALASGTAVRTLQEFLKDHAWSHAAVRDIQQQHVATTLGQLPADELGTVGVVDETGIVKKGRKTPGVQRQYCGECGKTENCIVTVHLAVARGRYKTLIDADLFLPQSWDADRDRCKEAGIPEDLHYQPKWRIAARQVLDALAAGIALDWLTFDEGYGDKPGFLRGLDALAVPYVGEVPKSFRCFSAPPRPRQKGHRADDLARHSPAFRRQPWQTFRLARQTLGEQEWQAKAAPVWLRLDGEPGRGTYQLIWARNEQTGEEKYFVCGGAAQASLGLRLRVGFTRWNVEHALRLGKTEIGLRHFEGRSYTGLMRHLMLSLVSMTFVADQAASLRGEKPGGDGRAGVPGPELGVRAVAGGAAGDEPVTVPLGCHPLSPTAESGGAGVAAASAVWLAGRIQLAGGPPCPQAPQRMSETA
jgi:SRSO17 transposase